MQQRLLFLSTFICALLISEKGNGQSLLDPSFGTGGKSIISFGNFPHTPDDMYVLPDGKILVSGHCEQPGYAEESGYLARVNQDGSIDSTFGVNGAVPYIYENTYRTFKTKIAVQNDGKILLMTAHLITTAFYHKASVFRFHADGSRDVSFGVNGKVSSHIGFDFNPVNILITEDGKIIVGGYDAENGGQFAAIKFLSNGIKDNSFDSDGKVSIKFNEPHQSLRSILLFPDGRLLLFGDLQTSPYRKLAMAMLKPNGVIDSTFSFDGKITTTFGNQFVGVITSTFLSNGNIRLTGLGGPSILGAKNAIFQIHPDGSTDLSFGNNGATVYSLIGSTGINKTAHITDDGKTYLGGNSFGFAMIRANADGSLDSTFYDNGIFLGSNYPEFDSIGFHSIYVQPDGKIIGMGEYQFSNFGVPNSKFALFRFLADSVSSVPFIEQPIKKLSAFPNPVSASFTLDYTLQSPTPVTITLYDQNGRKVQNLLPTSQRSAGNHSEQFNLQNLPSGIYSLELSTGQFSRTVQVVKK